MIPLRCRGGSFLHGAAVGRVVFAAGAAGAVAAISRRECMSILPRRDFAASRRRERCVPHFLFVLAKRKRWRPAKRKAAFWVRVGSLMHLECVHPFWCMTGLAAASVSALPALLSAARVVMAGLHLQPHERVAKQNARRRCRVSASVDGYASGICGNPKENDLLPQFCTGVFSLWTVNGPFLFWQDQKKNGGFKCFCGGTPQLLSGTDDQ